MAYQLDYYLPQPGLLDPALNAIVPPLMDAIASAVDTLSNNNTGDTISRVRLARLGCCVNWVVKVRGCKAVGEQILENRKLMKVPYFPSTISYLPKLAKILSPPRNASTSRTPLFPHHSLLSGQDVWEIRAVLLLWLGLLLTVPFELAALGGEETNSGVSTLDATAKDILFHKSISPTAQQIISILVPLLHQPGKEGSYAALALARLLSRSDGSVGLAGFFSWAARELSEGDREGEAKLCRFPAGVSRGSAWPHLA